MLRPSVRMGPIAGCSLVARMDHDWARCEKLLINLQAYFDGYVVKPLSRFRHRVLLLVASCGRWIGFQVSD